MSLLPSSSHNREVSLHVVLHYTVKFHVGVANFGVETPVHDVSCGQLTFDVTRVSANLALLSGWDY